ncbi:MAG: 2-phosphosulfolactate phosphatase [candidate division Zixibacteria bacterium]|nr:2-phosphosulfolactate phosphatase [candidate division Zixibacteria bacterium]NIR65108.1 2-phosphosulfolactate phosphatase [candidate division Zixibacteria bacterium]NIS17842.1 2-phosphosulfolactate phosphatase [candidate division Zixibacteria bacterium]NIS46852.1 2-phosphosulfolactate phosphatase [candidate division Zixibacteria bacterium]NIT54564.1 2-phosphosulfolactate phosphatase [candidate division Zixibacteria bacterium]
MNIRLFFTPAGIGEEQINGRTAVVIDILRATTVAAVALGNGAREIIPVTNLGDATSLREKLDRSAVQLGGEREGQKVDGFDLGNSPFEYGPDAVENKTVILATTNGSAAILKGGEAKYCLSCAFVNLTATLEKILEIKDDISVICAGNKGGFSLEDALCGGMLVDKLLASGGNMELDNDAAFVSQGLYHKHRDNLEEALHKSDHGKYLDSLGFSNDVSFCAQKDSLSICPVWQSGRLTLLE